MQKIITRLLSALTKEKKIGLIRVLAAGAILFCPNALASKAQPTESLKLNECLCGQRGKTYSKAQPPESLKLKAESGDPDAQYQLGEFYWKEGFFDREQSSKEAFKWYKLAGEQGQADAQYTLGRLYGSGWGVEQSYKEALKWTKRAVEQGHADAQFQLGWIYEFGQGVEQSLKEALKWYKLAGENGHVGAQMHLDYLSKSGKAQLN